MALALAKSFEIPIFRDFCCIDRGRERVPDATTLLVVGQDLSIGYRSHTATTVTPYLQESFALRVLSPAAGIPLAYAQR